MSYQNIMEHEDLKKRLQGIADPDEISMEVWDYAYELTEHGWWVESYSFGDEQEIRVARQEKGDLIRHAKDMCYDSKDGDGVMVLAEHRCVWSWSGEYSAEKEKAANKVWVEGGRDTVEEFDEAVKACMENKAKYTDRQKLLADINKTYARIQYYYAENRYARLVYGPSSHIGDLKDSQRELDRLFSMADQMGLTIKLFNNASEHYYEWAEVHEA